MKIVVVGYNSAIFSTEMMLYILNHPAPQDITLIIRDDFWLDSVHQHRIETEWGQRRNEFPLFMQSKIEIESTTKCITFKKFKEVRSNILTELKGKGVQVISKNVYRIDEGEKEIIFFDVDGKEIHRTEKGTIIWNTLRKERENESIKRSDDSNFPPHTDLYKTPKTNDPVNLVIYGSGLSALWIKEQFNNQHAQIKYLVRDKKKTAEDFKKLSSRNQHIQVPEDDILQYGEVEVAPLETELPDDKNAAILFLRNRGINVAESDSELRDYLVIYTKPNQQARKLLFVGKMYNAIGYDPEYIEGCYLYIIKKEENWDFKNNTPVIIIEKGKKYCLTIFREGEYVQIPDKMPNEDHEKQNRRKSLIQKMVEEGQEKFFLKPSHPVFKYFQSNGFIFTKNPRIKDINTIFDTDEKTPKKVYAPRSLPVGALMDRFTDQIFNMANEYSLQPDLKILTVQFENLFFRETDKEIISAYMNSREIDISNHFFEVFLRLVKELENSPKNAEDSIKLMANIFNQTDAQEQYLQFKIALKALLIKKMELFQIMDGSRKPANGEIYIVSEISEHPKDRSSPIVVIGGSENRKVVSLVVIQKGEMKVIKENDIDQEVFRSHQHFSTHLSPSSSSSSAGTPIEEKPKLSKNTISLDWQDPLMAYIVEQGHDLPVEIKFSTAVDLLLENVVSLPKEDSKEATENEILNFYSKKRAISSKINEVGMSLLKKRKTETMGGSFGS